MSEKKILLKLIEDGKKAERDLAALDTKPELRHGDYGHYHGSPRLFCRNGEGVLQPVDTEHAWGDDANTGNRMCGYAILGNIFDDIAERGGGLKEFTVKSTHSDGRYGTTIGVFVTLDGCANIRIEGGYTFEFDDLQKIYKQLGQVINYVRSHS